MSITIFGFKIFSYHSECEICGKRGFRMNKNNNIYCKRHWDYYFDEIWEKSING